MKAKSEISYKLYLVTDKDLLFNFRLEEAVEEAILGGVTLVQLREKKTSTKDFYNIAIKVKEITDRYDIPLIINDRLDIALSVDAAGLHIGQNDLPVNVARRLLGKNKILGVSASTLEEALEAEAAGADYIGSGAVFVTDTKKDADSVSLEHLRVIKEKIHIPLVAIGGINENNIDLLKGTGIDGVAVVSAIIGKKDIKKAAQELKKHVL